MGIACFGRTNGLLRLDVYAGLHSVAMGSPFRRSLRTCHLPVFPSPARFFAPPLSPFPYPSLLSCCPRPDLLTVSPLPKTAVAFLVMPGGKEHFLRSGARVSLTPLRSVLENRSFRHGLMNVQLWGSFSRTLTTYQLVGIV